MLVELRIEVTTHHQTVAVWDRANCEFKLADSCGAACVLWIAGFCSVGHVDVDDRELALWQCKGDYEVGRVMRASRSAALGDARTDKDARAMVLKSTMVVQLPALSRQCNNGGGGKMEFLKEDNVDEMGFGPHNDGVESCKINGVETPEGANVEGGDANGGASGARCWRGCTRGCSGSEHRRFRAMSGTYG